MARVVVTMQVQDAAKWEAGFLARGAWFKAQTVTRVHYRVTDRHEAVLCFEVDDLQKLFDGLRSQLSMEALAIEGVKLDTLKLWVLDKTFEP